MQLISLVTFRLKLKMTNKINCISQKGHPKKRAAFNLVFEVKKNIKKTFNTQCLQTLFEPAKQARLLPVYITTVTPVIQKVSWTDTFVWQEYLGILGNGLPTLGFPSHPLIRLRWMRGVRTSHCARVPYSAMFPPCPPWVTVKHTQFQHVGCHPPLLETKNIKMAPLPNKIRKT